MRTAPTWRWRADAMPVRTRASASRTAPSARATASARHAAAVSGWLPPAATSARVMSAGARWASRPRVNTSTTNDHRSISSGLLDFARVRAVRSAGTEPRRRVPSTTSCWASCSPSAWATSGSRRSAPGSVAPSTGRRASRRSSTASAPRSPWISSRSGSDWRTCIGRERGGRASTR